MPRLEEMQPGRELDALIARHVMGWAFCPAPDEGHYCKHCGRVSMNCVGDCHYSTRDDAAKAVVGVMVDKGFNIEIDQRRDAPLKFVAFSHYVSINDEEETFIEGMATGTLALAVCVAALRALEVSLCSKQSSS